MLFKTISEELRFELSKLVYCKLTLTKYTDSGKQFKIQKSRFYYLTHLKFWAASFLWWLTIKVSPPWAGGRFCARIVTAKINRFHDSGCAFFLYIFWQFYSWFKMLALSKMFILHYFPCFFQTAGHLPDSGVQDRPPLLHLSGETFIKNKHCLKINKIRGQRILNQFSWVWHFNQSKLHIST